MHLISLYDHLEAPPIPGRERRRRERTNHYPFVRRVKGGAYQARPVAIAERVAMSDMICSHVWAETRWPM
jgi:hypothetical protein